MIKTCPHNTINITDKTTSYEDIELFLGPIEDIDVTHQVIEPHWNMAHVMYFIGMFNSVSQARKNGWNKLIPDGYSEHVVGKNKTTIYILHNIW